MSKPRRRSKKKAKPPPAARRGPQLLREALDLKGWKQCELSIKAKVTPSTVARWLSGERVPDREHMGILRELLNISPEVWV